MPKSVSRPKPPSPSRSPAVRDGAKRVVFTVSVLPGLLKRFDEVARRQNRSRAGMITTLMQRAVEDEP